MQAYDNVKLISGNVIVEMSELKKDKTQSTNTKASRHISKELFFMPIFTAAGLMYFFILALPVFSIFQASGLQHALMAINDSENLAAFKLSLFTTAIVLICVFILGTPVVYALSNKKNMFLKLFEVIIYMPTVLPPAVVGIGLLLAFGRNGYFGEMLSKYNIEVVFTPLAVMLAQFFVSSGFYIQVVKTGLDSIDRELFEVTYILGAGPIETFLRVIVPMLRKPIIVGLILSWTRALGEFGATIMFAGNAIGKTRTVPLQIYTLMQTDIRLAAAVSMMMFIISFSMLFAAKIWLRE